MNRRSQVKSKNRVAAYGEVLTAEREVSAMLDLVRHETERIDSRFLEPACGDGNFLVEILNRKLAQVKKQYGGNPIDYEKYAVLAVTSVYGIDILPDNIERCVARLFDIFEREYSANCKEAAREECRQAALYILHRGIICGDALTMKTAEGNPIIFSEWSLVTGDLIKRRDFRFDEMIQGQQKRMSILSREWEYDEEIKAFIPPPVREFPPIPYTRVQSHG
jgi:hypothetical protein